MIEHLKAERLSLRRRSQIRLEPVRVDHRYEGLHRVQRRTSFGDVLRNVASTARQNRVHS